LRKFDGRVESLADHDDTGSPLPLSLVGFGILLPEDIQFGLLDATEDAGSKRHSLQLLSSPVCAAALSLVGDHIIS
jgi:hypothetical protein